MSSRSRVAVDTLSAAIDELLGVEPIYLSVEERRAALVAVTREQARLQAALMRMLAASDDIAVESGDRTTAAWLANSSNDAPGAVRRTAALAKALDSTWTQTAAALASGEVNLNQARAITESLALLPTYVDQTLRDKAEAYLVKKAAFLGPRELRTLGERVLEHLAPEIAEEAEYERLVAEDARAAAVTQLHLSRRGDGTTDIRARIPDHAANRLRGYLNAFTNPRRGHLDGAVPLDGDDATALPLPRRRGLAFVALLENVLADRLLRQGGTATSIMVTLDLDTLVAGVGVATTSTGDRITAGTARRLACQAGIIPVVLGGKSEILDLGRAKRLFEGPIRKALNLKHPECTAAGCRMPAEFCEAHHKIAWSCGGRTRLEDGTLLCSHHHHRAHDPAWITTYHPDGTTTFVRRQ